MEQNLKMNDPVVIIDGELKGRLGYYKYPYPYPEGDPINPKSIIELATRSFSSIGQVMLYDNQFIPVVQSAEDMQEAKANENILPYMDLHKFYVDNRVLIKYGEFRGCVVKVVEIKEHKNGRLFDYVVGPVKDRTSGIDINITVPEEYLEFWNRENPDVTIGGINVGKILKNDTMAEIARDIYEEVVRDHVEEVIHNRTFGNTSMTDFILSHVASKIIEETCDEFRINVVNRAKKIIDGSATESACEWFDQSLESSLITVVTKYMDDHKEDIIKIMEDRIKAVATKKANDIITKALYRSIDFQELLKNTINNIE